MGVDEAGMRLLGAVTRYRMTNHNPKRRGRTGIISQLMFRTFGKMHKDGIPKLLCMNINRR
jgi:hypothetical protein